MATLTTIWAGPDSKVVDVTTTGDGDVPIPIPHGLSATPEEIMITSRSTAGSAEGWFVSAKDATNVTIDAAGGAEVGAALQVRVTMRRPHSIGR